MFEYMFNGLKYILGYEPKQRATEIFREREKPPTQEKQPTRCYDLLLKKNEGYKNVNSNAVLDYV